MRIHLLLRCSTTLADTRVCSGDWFRSIAVDKALCRGFAAALFSRSATRSHGTFYNRSFSAQLHVRYYAAYVIIRKCTNEYHAS